MNPAGSQQVGKHPAVIPQSTLMSSVLNQDQSDLKKILDNSAEQVYDSHRKKPLGTSYRRGVNVPQEQTGMPLGLAVKYQDPDEMTKTIKNSDTLCNTKEDEMQYKKSHHSTSMGEQFSRSYKWPEEVNPEKTAFGLLQKKDPEGVPGALKDETFRGITHIVNKKTEDSKNKEQLGKSKIGVIPPESNHTFGKTYPKDPDGVAGSIKSCDTMDQSIAHSTIRNKTNISADPSRIFGTPSIRCDVMEPKIKSVANSTNYGSDLPVSKLLTQQLQQMSKDMEWSLYRDIDECREILKSAGLDSSDLMIHFDDLVEIVASPDRKVSLKDILDQYNDYLARNTLHLLSG
eukprot:GHVL01011117.1.p1 GENE.GHVL01011117.1~~GHVL01011117.1.p1  ORF type:complete len:345 (+),score=59.31 GHVL01011117.1:2612-3646(+)